MPGILTMTLLYCICLFAVADIPGLMPGAHTGFGLGHSFLRHVERCHYLIYVLDASESRMVEQLSQLQKELEMYKPGLSSNARLVVASKMDLDETEQHVEELAHYTNLPIIPVSGLNKWNTNKLNSILYQMYKQCKAEGTVHQN